MEILVLVIGFYLINVITNRIAVMSPFLAMLIYFLAVMYLFRIINRRNINKTFQRRKNMYQKQNQQFHAWQQNASEKEYLPQNFKVRDDIIDAEYTETEIKES